jgi:tetratricopeptide (TPR) repeat protein
MSRFENLEFGREDEDQPLKTSLSRDGTSFLDLAQEAFQAGKFSEALRLYSKVLEFTPQSPQAWTGQVRMLIELGEFDEAKVWADKALALFPDEAELLAAKGVALARLGDLNGAISFSDAAVEARMNTPYIWLARGDVLLARKEQRAEFCFQKALDLAANNWFVLWLASRIQSYYKRFARSLKLAQEALALDGARAVLWVQVAQCQASLGLVTQANRSIEQAHELDPEFDPRDFLREISQSTFLDKLAGRWRQWFQK